MTKSARRRNFRAARLRRKLRLARAAGTVDQSHSNVISYHQCDCVDIPAPQPVNPGSPFADAQEKAPPETGAAVSNAPQDEGKRDDTCRTSRGTPRED